MSLTRTKPMKRGKPLPRGQLADRVANVETCLHEGDAEPLAMYRREHAEFRAQLHSASLHLRVYEMWAYLNTLLGFVPSK